MEKNTNKYWKGLDELHNSEEFEKHRHNEFAEKLPLSKVIKEDELGLTATRRDFLKFMGFGITAATLAACSQSPVKNAIPYVNKPVEIEPGVANDYASTCGGCNARCSILVKTREGRPIKIEGNAESPFTKGAVCAVGQGTVLSLYDLGRQKTPTIGGKSNTWAALDNEVAAALNQGGNIRVLTGTVSSPSTKAIIDGFVKKHNAKHIQYDASSASALRLAHGKAFDKEVIPSYRIDKVKTLLAVDADFLGTWISPVEYTKMYTAARNTENGKDNYLYHIQFESALSLAGSNADLRATMAPSQAGEVLVHLHNMIAGKAGRSTAGNAQIELAGNAIKHAADALWASKGRSLVICGSNDVNHQLVVAAINSMLGAYGTTADIDNPSYQKQGSDADMNALVKEMESGAVNTLIVYDCNPAYTYPKGFEAALKNVKVATVSITDRTDETSIACKYVAPTHHFLEAWGDDMPKAGYVSLYQPTISNIFNTRQVQDTFLLWSGDTTKYEDYLRNFWKENYLALAGGGGFDDFFNKSLEMGFISIGMKTPQEYNDARGAAEAAGAASANSYKKGEVEVIVYEKVGLRDGRDANNPWLQELPDPISKVTWDNYAAISPKMADKMGLKDEDVVEISGDGYSVKLPVLRQPGQRTNTVAIAAGYGRGNKNLEDVLKVANGVGKNAYPFATITGDTIMYGGKKVTIKKTGETYELALTQTHHHMEGRDHLVRETGIAELISGEFAKEQNELNEGEKEIFEKNLTLWKNYKTPGHHWGLAVDLSACTGCGACVISCQAENNVPVVGKDEVRRRREMHWIRIDRYYAFADSDKPESAHYLKEFKKIDAANASSKPVDYENIQVVFQPLMCQHCTNAPCESVCPVNAISHSSEGLNQQAYNRCVGTRYCANNCPYKVRRFNWFNYAKNEKFKDYTMETELGRMVLNPDVTVRTRGVMEKCTMCVQRIQMGKLDAKKEGRALKDGAIKVACQQTCPANAIVFGDMNDPNSEISKMYRNQRTYRILTQLNTRPVVNYMAKVRNSPEEVKA